MVRKLKGNGGLWKCRGLIILNFKGYIEEMAKLRSMLKILFLTCICLCALLKTACGQGKARFTYRVEKSISDTLGHIQGTWDFDHLELLGKRRTKTAYYVTGLQISGSRFGMQKSEAASSGAIVRRGGRVFLVEEASGEGYPGDTLEIAYLKKEEMRLLHLSQNYSYIFPKHDAPHDVLYIFSRPR